MRTSAPSTSTIASALLVTASLGLLSAAGGLAPAQRFAGDALLRLVVQHAPAPAAQTPDVALVAIDPQSLRAFPSWPWPRSLYARAIERLDAAGARAIAFDIDLSTPRDPGEDAALAAAIARSGRVVLAGFRQLQPMPGGGELEVANIPIPAFAESASALGSVLMPIDSDGIVRRAPRHSAIGGREFETLAGAALNVAADDRAARARPRGGPQLLQKVSDWLLGRVLSVEDAVRPRSTTLSWSRIRVTSDRMLIDYRRSDAIPQIRSSR